MSVRTMARVWEHSQHAGSDLLMLLAIADFADDEGRAFPSISTLATKCRTTPRYAIKLLDALIASGELEVQKNAGALGRGGRTNLYRIKLTNIGTQPGKGVNQSALVNQRAPVHQGSETSEPEDNEVVHQGSPKPSGNHQEPPVSAKPRKGGRSKSTKTTFKAWYEAAEALNPAIFALDDPIHGYMTKVGMSTEFLHLHWFWFKAKHLSDTKLQDNWLQTFRNSVKGNYGRLWYRSDSGVWKLTTAGIQAALEHELDETMVSTNERTPDYA